MTQADSSLAAALCNTMPVLCLSSRSVWGDVPSCTGSAQKAKRKNAVCFEEYLDKSDNLGQIKID